MNTEGAIRAAYLSRKRIQGLTHGVYRYPARFSPEFVRACVDEFTKPGDLVLDPFVGAGTSAIESLASGRRFAGFDINPLAILLTRAKTTPLYPADRLALTRWLDQPFQSSSVPLAPDERLRNAPADLVDALTPLVRQVSLLPSPRQRDAAQAVLLQACQWAVDGRTEPATPAQLISAVREALVGLLEGIEDLKSTARGAGVNPSSLPRRRVLRTGPSEAAARHPGANRLAGRGMLVVTSPPYPGVHVLYHRWQVRGRAETPMPYWLADLQDGLGPKHYTMGGRTAVGQAQYFEAMRSTWLAIRRLLHPAAIVVQLVAFTDPDQQLERYQEMMSQAGYERAAELEPDGWRPVPNRRWYIRVQPNKGLGREILLTHRVSR